MYRILYRLRMANQVTMSPTLAFTSVQHHNKAVISIGKAKGTHSLTHSLFSAGESRLHLLSSPPEIHHGRRQLLISLPLRIFSRDFEFLPRFPHPNLSHSRPAQTLHPSALLVQAEAPQSSHHLPRVRLLAGTYLSSIARIFNSILQFFFILWNIFEIETLGFVLLCCDSRRTGLHRVRWRGVATLLLILSIPARIDTLMWSHVINSPLNSIIVLCFNFSRKLISTCLIQLIRTGLFWNQALIIGLQHWGISMQALSR